VPDQPIKYSFVAPALIFLILFNIFPLFYTLFLSFTNAELSSSVIDGVGVRNFGVVFDDPRYASALRTTGLFVVLAVSLELMLGFCLALAI
jgi:multiple sugar transport system permease protein